MLTSGVRLSGDKTSRKKSEGLKFLGQGLPVELKKGIASATSPRDLKEVNKMNKVNRL